MAEKSLTEHYLRSLEADNERLEAENKRLREALGKISNLTSVNVIKMVCNQALEGGGE